MSETSTIERDQTAAVEALKAEYGDFVLTNIRQRPVAAINVARAAWGEAPLLGTAEVNSRATHPAFAKHTVEAFVAYLAEHSDALNSTQAVPESRLDTEDFTTEQRSTFARQDEQPEPEPEAPKPYDQDAEEDVYPDTQGTLWPQASWNSEDDDASDFLADHVQVINVPVPDSIAVGGAISDSVVEDIEGAQHLVSPPNMTGAAEPQSASNRLGEDGVRRVIGAHDITVLRKASRGIVKGGYSLKKPALIDALVAEWQAHPNDIDLVLLVGAAAGEVAAKKSEA